MRWIVLLLTLLAAPLLGAKDTELLSASAKFDPAEVVAGAEVTLKVSFTVAPGYHAYHKDNPGIGQGMTPKLTELAGMETVGEIKWPDYVVKTDPDLGDDWVLEDSFNLVWTLKAPASAKDKLTVKGKYEAQVCNDDGCTMQEGKFEATLTIKAAETPKEAPPKETPKETPKKDGSPKEGKSGGNVEPTEQSRFEDEIALLRAEVSALKNNNSTVFDFKDVGPFGGLKTGETFRLVYADEPRVIADNTFQSGWNTWANAKKGDWVEYKFAAGMTKKFEVTDVSDAGVSVTVTLTPPEGAKPVVTPAKGQPWSKISLVSGLIPSEAEWPFEPVKRKIGEREIECVVSKWSSGDTTVTNLYSTAIPCGGVVCCTTNGEERIWLSAWGTVAAEAPKPVEAPKPDAPKGEEKVEWPKDLPAGPNAQVLARFKMTPRFAAEKVKPGAEITLELAFETFDLGIKDESTGKTAGLNHLYHPKSPSGQVLDLQLLNTAGLEPAGDWQYPPHHVTPADPENFIDEAWVWDGKFSITRKFKVPADAKLGKILLTGTANGQVCDEAGCLPLRKFGWFASVEVSADAPAIVDPPKDGGKVDPPKDGGKVDPPKDGGKIEPPKNNGGAGTPQTQDSGLLAFLLTAFGAGLLSLLTPCVLPVLPLTIGFFVKQSEQKRSPLVTAGIYASCIMGSYVAIGLITTLALGKQGAQLFSTNGYVNVALGLMFVVFALSFLGLFELRVPVFITSKFSRAQFGATKQGKGYVAALLSGSSFSLISFSCTAPIAALILAKAAAGDYWTPTLGMLAYSAGMAMPIFIMGQFPALMKKLPKSGGWMNAIKVVFGFVEIALAINYFANADMAFQGKIAPTIITREIVMATWIVCAGLSGFYLLGRFRLPHDHEPVEQIGVVRTLIAAVFLVFALFLTPGLINGTNMGFVLEGILPPPGENHSAGGNGSGGGTVSNDPHKLPWLRDYEAGLKAAKAQGKPIFVDFTGIN
ncbi:MAG: hypothetical protein IT462_06680 [Planctomycetes bacterium]|nr:hypothetical protein [Planctomycetota bacterium]